MYNKFDIELSVLLLADQKHITWCPYGRTHWRGAGYICVEWDIVEKSVLRSPSNYQSQPSDLLQSSVRLQRGQTYDTCVVPTIILLMQIHTNVKSLSLSAKLNAISKTVSFLRFTLSMCSKWSNFHLQVLPVRNSFFRDILLIASILRNFKLILCFIAVNHYTDHPTLLLYKCYFFSLFSVVFFLFAYIQRSSGKLYRRRFWSPQESGQAVSFE